MSFLGRSEQGIIPHLDLYSLNRNLEFESKAVGTQYAAGGGPKGAFEVLIQGDAWMIYRNTKTGLLHWDFVSRPSATVLYSSLTTREER